MGQSSLFGTCVGPPASTPVFNTWEIHYCEVLWKVLPPFPIQKPKNVVGWFPVLPDSWQPGRGHLSRLSQLDVSIWDFESGEVTQRSSGPFISSGSILWPMVLSGHSAICQAVPTAQSWLWCRPHGLLWLLPTSQDWI